jgi:hypothetical protein
LEVASSDISAFQISGAEMSDDATSNSSGCAFLWLILFAELRDANLAPGNVSIPA